MIYGRNREEHDARLKQVREIARENNIKLNKAKCKIAQTEVQYLGRELSREGIQPDKAKIKAILEMPTPESKKDLERFLGMIQYIGRFIPSLSETSAPLRILLKKESEWHWEQQFLLSPVEVTAIFLMTHVFNAGMSKYMYVVPNYNS